MGKLVSIDKDTATIAEAADILGVKYSTAYKWIVTERKIEFYDYGRTKIAVKSSVEAFKKSMLVKIKKVV